MIYTHVPSFLFSPIHMHADIRGKIQNEMIHILATDRNCYKERARRGSDLRQRQGGEGRIIE